jgi:hypothetical protein
LKRLDSDKEIKVNSKENPSVIQTYPRIFQAFSKESKDFQGMGRRAPRRPQRGSRAPTKVYVECMLLLNEPCGGLHADAAAMAPIGPMRYRLLWGAARNGQIAGADAGSDRRQTPSRVGSNQGRKQCTV